MVNSVKTIKWKEIGLDFGADLLGSFIFAVSLQCFSAPNQIAPGGVSGLCIVVNYLTGMPMGVLSMLMNVPLLLIGWRFLGTRFTVRTLITVAIMSVVLDVTALFLPTYTGNMLLASIFGGVLLGAGMGLIFMRGSTTGGTDIICKLLQKWFPHIQLGKIVIAVDVVVVALAALVFEQVASAMYAMISAYIAGKGIDALLYGMETGKLLYIISPKSMEIARRSMEELERGCTVLKAMGAYSKQERDVLLIAVRHQQYYTLKRIIHEVDPQAFLIVTDSTEVLGEGFKSLEKEN